MKYFILIFSFISQYGFSQNNYNFTTQNNQIEWQKVLEINKTRNEIESILKSNGIFKNVNFSTRKKRKKFFRKIFQRPVFHQDKASVV